VVVESPGLSSVLVWRFTIAIPLAHAIVVSVPWPQPSACPEHLKSVLRELLLSKTGASDGREDVVHSPRGWYANLIAIYIRTLAREIRKIPKYLL
jgi:hypothetical protein